MRIHRLSARPLRACLVAALIMAACACSSSKSGDETKTAQPAPAQGVVVLTQEQESAAGLQVVTLKAERRREQTEAWGRVLSVQDLASTRQAVAAAVAASLSARAQNEQAQQEYRRVDSLHAQDATMSQKSLEAARAAAEGAKAALDSAEAALASQRSVAIQTWGTKLAADLEHGGSLAADILAFRAVPLLVTQTGEAAGTPPERAEVTVGNQKVEAAFVSVVPRTDGVLQSPAWLYAVRQGTQGLAAGQNLKVFLPSGPEREGIVVPQEAGLWWQGSLWVYLREGDGHFRRTPLANPSPAAAGWFVSDGLKAGDALVVQGAQVLFSEELKSLNPGGAGD